MLEIIAGIAVVVFMVGLLVVINKVLKIPSGKVTGCCGGGEFGPKKNTE
jgi:hypothetical protein